MQLPPHRRRARFRPGRSLCAARGNPAAAKDPRRCFCVRRYSHRFTNVVNQQRFRHNSFAMRNMLRRDRIEEDCRKSATCNPFAVLHFEEQPRSCCFARCNEITLPLRPTQLCGADRSAEIRSTNLTVSANDCKGKRWIMNSALCKRDSSLATGKKKEHEEINYHRCPGSR